MIEHVPHRDTRARARAATRASARAARSARRRRSSTRWPTRSRRSASTITRLPLTPAPRCSSTARREGGGDVKPAPFDYHAPDTVDEAVGLLAELGDDAKVLAGGQSLVPMLALRLAMFEHLVDLRRVDELRGIERRDGDAVDRRRHHPGHRRARPTEVAAAVPLLARATPFIGHFQIRNRGTIGGSLAHADPAAEYPAVALALDAELEAAVTDRAADDPRRRVLHRHLDHRAGRRRDARRRRASRSGRAAAASPCEELARRHGDFAIAGAGVAVELDDDGTRARGAASACSASARRRNARTRRRGRGRRRGRRPTSTPPRSAALAVATLDVGPVRPPRVGRLPRRGRRRPSSRGPGRRPSRRPCVAEIGDRGAGQRRGAAGRGSSRG